jgi:hypothetical protein
VPGGNFRHGSLCDVCRSERTAGQMHTTQPEIPRRTHPQLIPTTYTQRSFRNAARCADFRDIKRSVVICLQEQFKPRDGRGIVTISTRPQIADPKIIRLRTNEP